MATELSMPQMGFDMREGTVVRWLVSEGADVKIGDVVAEIETDKAVVEFEATAAGILRKILVSEGTSVPVGQAIAIIAAASEELTEIGKESEPIQETPPVESKSIPLPEPIINVPTKPIPIQEVRASPVARRLAQERHIDLSRIDGTGPGGRITKDDVLAIDPEPVIDNASSPSTLEGNGGEESHLSPMRQQIATVTVKSKQEIPHFYVSADVDMTHAMELRRQTNIILESQGIRISVNDMIIKACVGALKKYPKLNASFTNNAIQTNHEINVGIAIAEEDGLIVPAIMDCGDKTLTQISSASKDLIARSKEGSLRAQEYSGGTFSISNMGMFDVSGFIAIILPPQSAILAVGTVSRRPVVRDHQITVAELMSATLSVDHRVADGAEGAAFIVEVKRLLENPASLLL